MDFKPLIDKIDQQAQSALRNLSKTLRKNLQTKGYKLNDWLSIQDVQDAGSNKTITVLLRGTVDKVISGQPAFVRCSIEWTFSKSDLADVDKVPPVLATKIKALMLEASISSGAFDTTVGMGYDDTTTPPYSVARFRLRLKGLGITFDAFLGGLDDRGFELSIGELPVCVPLGTTGLAISGISGTYAHNFAPRLLGDPPNPTPNDYVSWSRKQQQVNALDTWKPQGGSRRHRPRLFSDHPR
jgi:hypothetical protein